MTGATQRAVKAWLTTQLPPWAALTPPWAPRILTGYQRATAGDALAQMEAGGEPDVIIVECRSAVPVAPTATAHWVAEVEVRIRHDCDRVSEANHSVRVNEVLKVIHDDDANTNLTSATYRAQLVIPTTQAQTSFGRSFETTLGFTVKGFPIGS